MSKPHCEQCGRETEFLFDGVLTEKRTRYEFPNGDRSKKPKAVGFIDVHRDAKVCQRCRPPSNLEIQELLDEGRYKGHTLELRSLQR